MKVSYEKILKTINMTPEEIAKTIEKELVSWRHDHFKGMRDAKEFKDLKELKRFLSGFLKAGDMVLLKASHGMHFETLLAP